MLSNISNFVICFELISTHTSNRQFGWAPVRHGIFSHVICIYIGAEGHFWRWSKICWTLSNFQRDSLQHSITTKEYESRSVCYEKSEGAWVPLPSFFFFEVQKD